MRIDSVGPRPLLRVVHPAKQEPARQTKQPESPVVDTWVPGRRSRIEKALRDVENRIEVRESEVGEARKRRGLHRRMAVVMSLMTLASSIVTLVLMFGPAAPLTTAIWVVPSAFGGSSVSQSIAAIMESRTIHRLLHELDALRVVQAELSSELRAITEPCARV